MMVRWLAGIVLVAMFGAPLAAAEVPGAPADTAAPKPKVLTADEQDYELFKVFVDTLDQVERNYVKEVDRRELMEAAIRGVLDKLDPYSNYISPEEVDKFRDTIESQFGGIGIQITMDGGVLKILSPLVGTPAYRAGLHAGDRILEIEGKSTEGINIDEAVRRLKGPVGTSVKIKLSSAYVGEVREVTLARENIRLETVLGDSRGSGDGWQYLFDKDKKIGYIRITSFSRETARELRDALRELEAAGLKGLVLDLRFNPGGLLNSAIDICDLFITEGKIVSTKGRNVEERVWEAHKAGTFTGFPMVVLVNRYSASASEIVSACLQDHKRAVVVGERTWGKGSVQNVINLEDGKSALKLTTASYWRPSGKNIHRFPDATEKEEWGVKPDEGYEVKLDASELRELVEVRRQRDLLVWSKDDAERERLKKAASTGGEKSDPKKIDLAPPAGTAKPEEKKSDDEKKADDEKQPAGEDEANPVEVKPGKFVDRQLERALEYLSAELVKAQ